MNGFRKKTVLVSPLDWGLGHATRCVPVIKELINQGVEVILGISGLSGHWLKQTFPWLESVEVPYYEIRYHKRLPMAMTAMLRYSAFKKMIKDEYQWLKSYCQRRKLDGIISDNRYGLYNSEIPSVCITHQLNINPGKWFFIQPYLNKQIRFFLKPFQEIWVPDFEGSYTLSGRLSHPPLSSNNIKYIGPLSRFNDYEEPKQASITYSVAFVLSGPEPLRTIFEERCIDIAEKLNSPFVIIRGTNKPLNISSISDRCCIINMADTRQLYQIVQQSECVVSRSGYSSIMDWYALRKKAVLVPTPGQTEQEYLARHLYEMGLFYYVKEEELSEQTIKNAKFSFNEAKQKHQTTLSSVIGEWLNKL